MSQLKAGPLSGQTTTALIPDQGYSFTFHSPGLEPWVLGSLARLEGGSTLLDLGCGHGLWGFLVKRFLKRDIYACGMEINPRIIVGASSFYDDVVLGDARWLPFRTGSFDVTIAIEVLHTLDSENLETCIESTGRISRALQLVALPFASPKSREMLKRHGFRTYRYLFRGLLLIELDGESEFTFYDNPFWKCLSLLMRVVFRLSSKLQNGYVLAVAATNENV